MVPPSPRAIYKGLAINAAGDRIYATNFKAGTVDTYDAMWQPILAGKFADWTLPEGYAPFGIQIIGATVYVTYALQDEDKEDDVAGVGHGFVNAFDTDGNLIRRVASRGPLNSPWGIALAPANFGEFSNDLLIGNFGDGRIHAFDPSHILGNDQYQRAGLLHSADGPRCRSTGCGRSRSARARPKQREHQLALLHGRTGRGAGRVVRVPDRGSGAGGVAIARALTSWPHVRSRFRLDEV